uniref:NOT2/NOT3/NOT5 C-terminal domain-containing protein n=1 Tax=Salix viminalis TaxID=40686 RepID=A0A6N2L9D7_SALVM
MFQNAIMLSHHLHWIIITFQNSRQKRCFLHFTGMPKDEAQLHAANILYERGWLYYKEQRRWFERVPNTEPLVKTSTYERGSYHCFEPNTFEIKLKENFVLHYEMVEKRPGLPQH